MSTWDEKALSDLWDQHLAAEFGMKDVEKILATMVPHPSVNHVPVMTGAIGRDQVRDFYTHVFLPQLPTDLESFPISRTIGQGRVVDEFGSRFTHSLQMDWLLPGIPATGKVIETTTVVIVQFENGKILSERLYWDHATILLQLGLIDPSLPVLGAEQAQQVRQPTQPMNALIQRAKSR